MLRVTALVPYPYDTAPSQRYRLEQWQNRLADLGVELRFQHLVTDPRIITGLQRRPPSVAALTAMLARSARRAIEINAGPAPDAWVVHRELTMIGTVALERLAARRAPIVFDFDDAIWMNAGEAGRRSLADRIRRPEKTNDILRMSRGVAAGNAYLADHAARFAPIVEIVPTTIDVRGAYARRPPARPNRPYTIGWTGSYSTATYIRNLLPTLAAISRQVPLRLLIIGVQGITHPGLEIECRSWRSATEVDDLFDMDVGLMPLADDKWARGKCGLKALQYMALGIPPVISPVGVNTEIVSPGENGYLATDHASWQDALTILADPSVRACIGENARATIHERYSAELGAQRLATLLERVSAAR